MFNDKETVYLCQKCGSNLLDSETVYVNNDGEMVGCSNCVVEKYVEDCGVQDYD